MAGPTSSANHRWAETARTPSPWRSPAALRSPRERDGWQISLYGIRTRATSRARSLMNAPCSLVRSPSAAAARRPRKAPAPALLFLHEDLVDDLRGHGLHDGAHHRADHRLPDDGPDPQSFAAGHRFQLGVRELRARVGGTGDDDHALAGQLLVEGHGGVGGHGGRVLLEHLVEGGPRVGAEPVEEGGVGPRPVDDRGLELAAV